MLHRRIGEALRRVKDPVLNVDVVSGGLVDVSVEDRRASLSLEVFTAAHPFRDSMAAACTQALEHLPLDEITLTMRASGCGTVAATPGLASVRTAIAVASCKGGVGKSTVAWQLAQSLRKLGGRVGVLDADVHGPSLPWLVGKPDARARPSPAGGGLALPVEHAGVRLASVGFVDATELAALRGPLAGRLATQLLTLTDWGELDYLVVDTPPGLGDVPISLFRELSVDAAVLVSTPSQLSKADVVRGLGLLDQFHVPVLALCRNMAYLDHGGTRISLFGDAPDDLIHRLPQAQAFDIPFSLELRDSNENARSHVDDAVLPMAQHLVETILRTHYAQRDLSYDASWDETQRAVVLRRFCDDDATALAVPADALLARRQHVTASASPPRPTRLALVGKRALSIDWSHGLKNDIFSLDALADLAQESPTTTTSSPPRISHTVE